VFERFTVEARSAIAAGERAAESLANEYVEPFHLLLGVLHVPDSVAGKMLARESVTLERATNRARLYGPRPAHQATGIFTEPARRVVAEGALEHAYRHRHTSIATGHLLLAILDASDPVTSQILGVGPLSERLAAEVLQALPGDEQA
jgi:ATP-dependent Clp protease ATP-binding subunit ClpC